MPRYFMTKTRLLLLLVFGSVMTSAQQLSWRNYTTAQGLPGNIVYDSMEDSKGYMWFVTNQGICRFNGYEFIQPADTSALKGSEAFMPTEDANGRIWFARLDASVWFIENDTVRAWKYNTVTAPYRQKFRPIEQLCVSQDQTVWMALNGCGLLSVNKKGDLRVIADSSSNSFIFTEVSKKILYSSNVMFPNVVAPDSMYMNIVRWKNGNRTTLGKLMIRLPFTEKYRGIWALRNGGLLCSSQVTFCLFHDDRLVWRSPAPMLVEKAAETDAGEILIASHIGPNCGLFYFASREHLRKGIYKNLLPGHFVTDFWCDRAGGWWATTHHAGVFYCKNPGIDVFNTISGLPSNDVVCLTKDGQKTLFAGLRPVDIIALDRSKGTPKLMLHPPLLTREVQAIFFDSLQQRLWCSDLLCFLEEGKWNSIISHDKLSGRRGETQGKKITPDPSGQMLWTSASSGFYRVDVLKTEADLIGRSIQSSLRTFSVTPDSEGNVWVTTEKGLRLWRNGQYELPPFDHPALHFQPRDLICLPDGGMAISLRATGVLFRDKQGKFAHFTKRDGLTSDFITKLYSSPDGSVFACSSAGLNHFKPQADGSWRIETISIKQGLPSNQVNDVITFPGEIWMATDQGLVRLHDFPKPYPMPAPVLEKLLINNKPGVFQRELRLAFNKNNLFIRFFSLHYRSDGNIPYRYRLLGADTTFVYSNNREVNFANLSPGTYAFEVQAQNENGIWSEPTRWTFEIRPAWWQTGWFFALMALFLVGGLAFWYRNRLLKTHRDAAIRDKIRDLESAALRAQMNPHFIFNCLNSIQHFITENDPALATRYLSRFARLVRLALHGSVDGRHSLKEETEMLENYLALEQLRFRGKFTYEVKCDPELDPDDIFLPPMLVQPFVENALLHGMKNKTEGGRISIVFSQKEGALIATVVDNGPGIDSDGADHPVTGHKSVGMTLTQRRLEILAGQQALLRENILAADGTVQGMRVVLHVPAN